jgi:hypothetical protein
VISELENQIQRGTYMKQNLTRRNFVAAAGVAALTTGLVQGAEGAGKTVKILGVACSPRKGMTTAKAVQLALDAAKGVDPRIEVELIDLGGLSIAGTRPSRHKTISPPSCRSSRTRRSAASSSDHPPTIGG